MVSFSHGIMFGTSILVGKSVGEENKNRAIKYFFVANLIAFLFTSLMILIVALLQDQAFGILTEQEAVLESVKDLVSVYFVTLFATSFMNVAYGMVRGLGKQAIATQISLVAVMISYAIAHFSFFHFDLGIVGLQSSIAVCTILMAIGFTSMVFCINWPNLFQEVRERKEKVTGVKNAGNNLE